MCIVVQVYTIFKTVCEMINSTSYFVKTKCHIDPFQFFTVSNSSLHLIAEGVLIFIRALILEDMQHTEKDYDDTLIRYHLSVFSREL